SGSFSFTASSGGSAAPAAVAAPVAPAAPSAEPLAAASSGSCSFAMGFKALHDLIPNTVKDFLGDGWHNPDNGTPLPLPARGRLVWRKLDNWTAFTDGSTTWINGPLGLQSRPNGDRFPWEKSASGTGGPASS